MNYPAEAKSKGITGTVNVSFIVEKDGSVSNVKVIRGVEKELDDEAVRVVQLSPKWAPGTNKGKPVRVTFTMPILFRIS